MKREPPITRILKILPNTLLAIDSTRRCGYPSPVWDKSLDAYI
jgi:hypothetical protein